MSAIHVSQSKKVSIPKKGINAYWMIGPNGIKSDKLSFGLVELQPKTRIETHKHVKEDEIIYIIEGHGRTRLGKGKSEIIEPGTTVFYPKNVNHSIENESKNSMKWCFCFIPPTHAEDHAK